MTIPVQIFVYFRLAFCNSTILFLVKLFGNGLFTISVKQFLRAHHFINKTSMNSMIQFIPEASFQFEFHVKTPVARAKSTLISQNANPQIPLPLLCFRKCLLGNLTAVSSLQLHCDIGFERSIFQLVRCSKFFCKLNNPSKFEPEK